MSFGEKNIFWIIYTAEGTEENGENIDRSSISQYIKHMWQSYKQNCKLVIKIYYQ